MSRTWSVGGVLEELAAEIEATQRQALRRRLMASWLKLQAAGVAVSESWHEIRAQVPTAGSDDPRAHAVLLGGYYAGRRKLRAAAKASRRLSRLAPRFERASVELAQAFDAAVRLIGMVAPNARDRSGVCTNQTRNRELANLSRYSAAVRAEQSR